MASVVRLHARSMPGGRSIDSFDGLDSGTQLTTPVMYALVGGRIHVEVITRKKDIPEMEDTPVRVRSRSCNSLPIRDVVGGKFVIC